MERIDDPSNLPAAQTPLATVSPGYFRRPSVLAGDQGTILTGDWATDVQEAIIDPILAAGITLVKGDETQLTDAINFLSDAVAAALISTHNTSASTLATGHIEIATSSEVAALGSTTLAVTPGRINEAFDAVLANPGYIKIPCAAGTLVVQFGSSTGQFGSGGVLVALPIAFPTSFVSLAVAGPISAGGGSILAQAAAEPDPINSLTQFRMYGTSAASVKNTWIAIGY